MNLSLIKDLLIPHPSGWYFLFPKGQFAFGYGNFQPNPDTKTLRLDVQLRNQDDKPVYTLTSLAVTEEGFDSTTITNQEDITAYNAKKLELTELIQTLTAKPDKTPLEEFQLGDATRQLAMLTPVLPIYEKILPYSEVIQWFNSDGTIKEECLPIAVELTIQGIKIKDYIA